MMATRGVLLVGLLFAGLSGPGTLWAGESSRYELAAYYFPGYHPEPRNDERFGAGWTEWQLVKAARPRFAGHRQPRVPVWGYRDESDPEAFAQKIDAAADHGITTLIFDWYWYENAPFLQGALDNGFLKAENRHRLKFALMWANHDWIDIFPYKRGTPRRVIYLGKTSPSVFRNAADYVIRRYFTDPGYWKIDGKPYFSIYHLGMLLDSFGSVEATRAALDDFRRRAQAAGLPGLHLNAVAWGRPRDPQSGKPIPLGRLVEALGFDSVTSYVWIHHVRLPKLQTDYQSARKAYLDYWDRADRTFGVPYLPNATVGWDSSPRADQSDEYAAVGYPFTNTIVANTPEQFAQTLRAVRRKLEENPNAPRIVTINSWNEWTEGSYLEPDTKYGMRYLEAVRAAFPPPGTSGPCRPNVLFLISDDLNCRIGCYGDRLAKTPNIDRLASWGVRFERAYCQFPLCNPTRCSVLTGLYPTTTGVLDNNTLLVLDGRIETIQDCFCRHGYAVAQHGKVWHGRNRGIQPGEPKPKGEWYTPEERRRQQTEEPDYWERHHSPYRHRTVADPERYAWANVYGPLKPGDRGRDAPVADQAIKSLRAFNSGDRPFFLAVGFRLPHVPLTAPKEFFDLHDPAAMPLPPDFANEPALAPDLPRDEWRVNLDLFAARRFSKAEAREAIRAYYACTSYMDAQLGRVLDALERLGLRDNTVIVFWGDHGWHLSEKGMWAKGTTFEVSAHGPLIIVDPRRKETAGSASPRVVQYLDIYPTLVDLCQLDGPKTLEGRSLRPLLENPETEWDHPALTVQTRGWFIGRSVRTERWRYTEWDEGRRGAMLFDHQTDPHEMHNLAADLRYADVVKRLKDLVATGLTGQQQRRLYEIVDTGQSTCHDNRRTIASPALGQPFYGQDAQYIGNQPAYRDNGDGTVTDLVTGLVWQKTPDFVMRSWEEARRYAQRLKLAGCDDWRLPTIKELFSLADFRGNMRTRTPYIDTRDFDFRYPDPSTGVRIMDAQYWSSTHYVGTTMRGDESAFGFNFADGRIKSYPIRFGGRRRFQPAPRQAKKYVRCVRGPAYGQNDFVDNGNGTITDRATGLMWTKSDSGRPMNWQSALKYAERLVLAGYDDWRLPNVKELQSIVDYTRAPDARPPAPRGPAIDPIFDVSETESWYWSSTTHLEPPFGAAYYVCFGQAFSVRRWNGRQMNAHGAGAVRSDPKAGDPARWAQGLGPQSDEVRIENYVRCVRGGAARKATWVRNR